MCDRFNGDFIVVISDGDTFNLSAFPPANLAIHRSGRSIVASDLVEKESFSLLVAYLGTDSCCVVLEILVLGTNNLTIFVSLTKIFRLLSSPDLPDEVMLNGPLSRRSP